MVVAVVAEATADGVPAAVAETAAATDFQDNKTQCNEAINEGKLAQVLYKNK